MLIKAKSAPAIDVSSPTSIYRALLQCSNISLCSFRRCETSPEIGGPFKSLTRHKSLLFGRSSSIYTQSVSNILVGYELQLSKFSLPLGSEIRKFNLPLRSAPKQQPPSRENLLSHESLQSYESSLSQNQDFSYSNLSSEIEENLRIDCNLLRLLKFELVDLVLRFNNMERNSLPPLKIDFKFEEVDGPTEGQLEFLEDLHVNDSFPDSYLYSADYRIRSNIYFSPTSLSESQRDQTLHQRDQTLRQIRQYRKEPPVDFCSNRSIELSGVRKVLDSNFLVRQSLIQE
jgi:hypothetical protein